MANTGKVPEQLRLINDGFEISHHTLLNRIISGLSSQVGQLSDIQLKAVGKRETGETIEVNLTGIKISPNDMSQEEDKVRQLMDTLRNPSKLIEIIGE